MVTNHLSQDQIEKYINLNLTEEETDLIIAHLSECETCLSLVDDRWQGEQITSPQLNAKSIRTRLFQEIHRSNLAGNLIRFGLTGFWGTIVGLTKPLLSKSSRTKNK